MCYLLTIKEKCIQDPYSVFLLYFVYIFKYEFYYKAKRRCRESKKKILTLIGQKCAKVSDFLKLKQTNGNSSTNILPGSTSNLYYTYL